MYIHCYLYTLWNGKSAPKWVMLLPGWSLVSQVTLGISHYRFVSSKIWLKSESIVFEASFEGLAFKVQSNWQPITTWNLTFIVSNQFFLVFLSRSRRIVFFISLFIGAISIMTTAQGHLTYQGEALPNLKSIFHFI